MAGLRHPNITLFLGLCFLEGSDLPLLVIERLEMSVDDLLECSPNIPLAVKISILTDTGIGLVYLHSREPPIVHRDLTARNILLTSSSLTAKITDTGKLSHGNFKTNSTSPNILKESGHHCVHATRGAQREPQIWPISRCVLIRTSCPLYTHTGKTNLNIQHTLFSAKLFKIQLMIFLVLCVSVL